MLKEGTSAETLESKLPKFIERYMGEMAATSNYLLQPLKEIYLYSTRDYGIDKTDGRDDNRIKYGDIARIHTASFVVCFILLIACINFTNLTTARSANRAREVGLRKVVGANRIQLAIQFLGESFLLTVLSLAIALCSIELILPAFGALTGIRLHLNLTETFILQLAGLVLVVSLIAGSYPALFLSHFRPIEVLKGTLATGSRSGVLRKILVTFQFGISVVLIVVTLLVLEQTRYIQGKSLGFDKDNIVELPIFWAHRNSSENKDGPLWLRYKAVKTAFLQHPNIKAASMSRFRQGRLAPFGFFDTYQGETGSWQMRLNEVDEGFIPCFNVELVAGRNFSENAALYGSVAAHRIGFGENKNAQLNVPESEYILTESAVKLLGWTDPIGKPFGQRGHEPGRVVGVVKDFHMRSLYESIEPAVLYASNGVPKTLFLKISPDHMEETFAFMKETWNQFLPTRPFTYTFLDENLNQLYHGENQFRNAMGIFSLLAIFVASLGLLGLISFMAERRRKEVGIRKVFGASETGIVALLVSESFKLVLMACLLAWPIAYLIVAEWLQGFAYRIDITVLPFLVGGMVSIVLSISVVMYQALKAARTNPVDALRYE